MKTDPTRPFSKPILNPEELGVAQRAANGLGRWLFVAASIELLATIVRSVADPAATPVVLADLAAVSRFTTSLFIALAMARLTPLASAHGLGAHAQALTGLYLTAGLVPLLRFFDIVPPNLSEAVWDAVLIGTFGVAFVLTTLGAAWFFRQLALARNRLIVARRFAVASAPPVLILPLILFAIAPQLSPHPILAAALTLLSPWLLVMGGPGRQLRPDQAMWLTLLIGTTLGLAVFLGTPLLAAGLSLTAAACLAAYPLASSLHLLADELTGRDALGPSATFLRRLVAGTLGGESSRVGDLPKDSRSDESDPDESLALAYRELGIEPHGPSGPDGARPSTSELVGLQPKVALDDVPQDLVPFVPKSRQHGRPDAEPEKPHHDWSPARRGFSQLFKVVLALILTVTFSSLFSMTPLGTEPIAITLFSVLLLALAIVALRGVNDLARGLPETAPRGPLIWVQLSLFLAVGSTSLMGLAPHLGFEVPATLLTSLAFIGALAGLAALLARLDTSLDEPRLAQRARTSLWLALSLGLLTFVRHLVLSLDASDLQWLAWPIGFVVVGLFVALAIGSLWLLKDAETATDRMSRR